MIFDENTLRKLNRLTLVAHQVRAGKIKGERRSTKRGSSIEFADYRNYSPGDDLRRLDWNIYGRLDRPFIKLLEEEEDLAVHILVDASRSMDWGEGDQHKFRYAVRLAGAFGAIALGAGDRLAVSSFHADKLAAGFGPARGQMGLMRYLSFLEGLKPSGTTDLNGALRSYAMQTHRPGLAFLISDLFSPSGYTDGLTQLQSRGYEVILIHLLAPDEIHPPQAGDLHLIDIETGQRREISMNGSLRDLYHRRLLAWQENIRLFCAKRNIRFLHFSTALPWDRVVLFEMRKAALVK